MWAFSFDQETPTKSITAAIALKQRFTLYYSLNARMQDVYNTKTDKTALNIIRFIFKSERDRELVCEWTGHQAVKSWERGDATLVISASRSQSWSPVAPDIKITNQIAATPKYPPPALDYELALHLISQWFQTPASTNRGVGDISSWMRLTLGN